MKQWVAPVLGIFAAAGIGAALLANGGVAVLDFHAFYCAGEAVRLHHDPYLTASLQGCEQRIGAGSFLMYDPNVVVPAPLPGYDLTFFALLSFLPFAAAKMLWGAILGASVFVACAALVQLTRFSAVTILCALVPTLIPTSLAIGQMIPVYCAASFACAALVSRRRYELAAVAAAVSLVEPHLGLPIVLSLLLSVPRTRGVLGMLIVVLGVISVVVCGLRVNLEYFRYVLPQHALAELPEDSQLSLTVILHALHVADAPAVALGTGSYILVSLLTIACAKRVAAMWNESAVLVALPAAGAVIGGSFMHGGDIVAAVPLALLMARAMPRLLPAIIACLVIGPWWSGIEIASGLDSWFVLAGCCTGYVFWALTKSPWASAGIGAVCLTILVLFHNLYVAQYHGATVVQSVPRIEPHIFADASWARAIRERFASDAPASWFLRALTWTGLAALLVQTLRSRRRRDQLNAGHGDAFGSGVGATGGGVT